MNPAAHLRRGASAERFACRWLQHQGLQLLHTNHRCKAGEIDLIMLDGECLVIVEVRFRRGPGYGGAAGSITARKQQRILRATRHLLQRYPALGTRPLRFDVVAITGARPARVDWRRHAFFAD